MSESERSDGGYERLSDKPQVGDKVRFTYAYEGRVVEVRDENIVELDDFQLGTTYHTLTSLGPQGAFEILERAKTKWQDGDVIHNVNTRDTLVRRRGNWITSRGQVFWHKDPVMPNSFLIPIIRAGEVVEPKAL